MLLQFSIFIPILDFYKILAWSAIAYKSQRTVSYSYNKTHLYESWYLPLPPRLILPSSPAPEHACLLIRSDIDSLERDAICLQDRFHARRSGDDVRGAGCEGRVEVQRGVVGVRRFGGRFGHFGFCAIVFAGVTCL